MKIVNEKGKLFGIINVVDLLVLLMIIAVIGVVGTKLFGTKVAEVTQPKSDCYMEVELYGCLPSRYDEVFRQDLVGERLVSGNSYMPATIEDVWLEDCLVSGTDDEGTVQYKIDSAKKNIVFLIKTQVSPDSASPAIGSQEMRAGKTFIVKTQTFETSGTIRYVNIGEYTGNGKANAVEAD